MQRYDRNTRQIKFASTTALGVKSLRDLMDDSSSSSSSSSKVFRKDNNNIESSNNNNGPTTINMNQGPDIKTMGTAEIKRELSLYGISVDNSNSALFMEKRDLEEALMRERSLRGSPPVSRSTSTSTSTSSSGTSQTVMTSPRMGNVNQNQYQTTSTVLNMSSENNDYISLDDMQQKQQLQQQQSSTSSKAST
eukprot:CAMPEP_0183749266 /NCGR_PEP_ID=MMETSP0737-20130205/68198_1 /TAXON_ID=385413 /ORGANISM="Thalassiosira miniscula, Strain CCMP1093" /LENGTH=192 /DNA_ID=CAMNT_0025985019 /DNA_START=539 /DNA_END=1113 /DNA_ORIENTATION=-